MLHKTTCIEINMVMFTDVTKQMVMTCVLNNPSPHEKCSRFLYYKPHEWVCVVSMGSAHM